MSHQRYPLKIGMFPPHKEGLDYAILAVRYTNKQSIMSYVTDNTIGLHQRTLLSAQLSSHLSPSPLQDTFVDACHFLLLHSNGIGPWNVSSAPQITQDTDIYVQFNNQFYISKLHSSTKTSSTRRHLSANEPEQLSPGRSPFSLLPTSPTTSKHTVPLSDFTTNTHSDGRSTATFGYSRFNWARFCSDSVSEATSPSAFQ